MAGVVAFRALRREDLPLIHGWLQRPHVARWWTRRETLEEVEEHYLPAIEGVVPSHHHLILLDERPIGLIETYLVADFAEEWPVEAGPGVAGVDLFIGEEELLHRGLGPQILRTFLRDVVFADPAVAACVAGPDVRNQTSIRAFEKAGFRRLGTMEIPGEEAPEQLVRIERADLEG